MIVLDSTSKSITVVMSGAAATNNPAYTTAYADNNGTSFTEGATDGVLSGTTPVTIISAPASSTRRIVNTITIENNDTAAVTLTIGYVNGANTRVIAKVTLQVGDTWTTSGAYDTNGNLKQILGTTNLATQVSGVLGYANGGTGLTSPGTNGNVLTSNGTMWVSSAPSGGVTSVSAGDGIAVSGTTAVTVSLDFYTGSTSTNTSYPIGTYIVAAARDGSSSFSSVANNATITLQNVSGSYFAKSGGTSCAGTWRSRGATLSAGCGLYGNLCQRTA